MGADSPWGKGRVTGFKKLNVLFATLLIAGNSLGVFLTFANTANAGVLSFLFGMLGDNQASASSATGSKYNSQNLAVLEAPLSIGGGTGGGDISIVDDQAIEYQDTIDDTQNDQISTYVVRQGDNLSQIAKMFNVSVNTIIWANDIQSGVITPGQNLVILPVSGIKVKVKTGDTVQSIVKAHNGDLQEVLQFNGLSADSKLAAGDEIIIPDGESTTVHSSAGTSGTGSAGSGSTSAKKPNLGGYFVKPLAHYVLTQGIHGHNGVDMAAPAGTPIYAAASGRVIISKNSGYNGGYGNYVVVAHPNGTQTLYAHMTKSVVVVGSSVGQGELLGYVGTTGHSSGYHLHFEIRGAVNIFGYGKVGASY